MTRKNGYKAVVFDLDGTLRHSVPNPSDISTAKVRELGFDVSDEKARETARWEHYYWASSEELRGDIERFDKNDSAFWQNYTERRLQALGATAKEISKLARPLRNHMRKKYRSEDFVPPELHEILPALREADYRLGVLSNRSDPFDKDMRRLDLAKYFDYVKAAGEVGSWKPNPAVFDPMLKHFEIAPQESLYIGDNYYADVLGARAAGMQPILYDPRELFPDPDCMRITSFHELMDILQS